LSYSVTGIVELLMMMFRYYYYCYCYLYSWMLLVSDDWITYDYYWWRYYYWYIDVWFVIDLCYCWLGCCYCGILVDTFVMLNWWPMYSDHWYCDCSMICYCSVDDPIWPVTVLTVFYWWRWLLYRYWYCWLLTVLVTGIEWRDCDCWLLLIWWLMLSCYCYCYWCRRYCWRVFDDIVVDIVPYCCWNWYCYDIIIMIFDIIVYCCYVVGINYCYCWYCWPVLTGIACWWRWLKWLLLFDYCWWPLTLLYWWYYCWWWYWLLTCYCLVKYRDDWLPILWPWLLLLIRDVIILLLYRGMIDDCYCWYRLLYAVLVLIQYYDVYWYYYCCDDDSIHIVLLLPCYCYTIVMFIVIDTRRWWNIDVVMKWHCLWLLKAIDVILLLLLLSDMTHWSIRLLLSVGIVVVMHWCDYCCWHC